MFCEKEADLGLGGCPFPDKDEVWDCQRKEEFSCMRHMVGYASSLQALYRLTLEPLHCHATNRGAPPKLLQLQIYYRFGREGTYAAAWVWAC